MFVKNIWYASQITMTVTQAECIGLQISCKEFSVVLISIYHPPSSNANLFLEELDKALSELSPISQLCLVGDFNINTMDSSRHIVCNYLNLMAAYGIESVIQAPTIEELLGDKLVSTCIDHVNIRTLTVL